MSVENRRESMWYCARCEYWIGYRKQECTNGHTRPRFPLRTIDVPGKPAYEVTWFDRIKAKINGILSECDVPW